jgi:hypothetical protein
MKFLSVFLLLLTAACGAVGTTTVTAPPENQTQFRAAKIERETSTVPVDNDTVQRFADKLADQLYNDGDFENRDGGLIVQFRFIEYDPGNRAKRALTRWTATGSGKGEITVEVHFLNSQRTEMSRITTGGEVYGGLIGGSIDNAIDVAAEKAGKYAKANFKTRVR